MATDAKLTADSSPADILKSLTPAQHKTWRETGEVPDLPAKKVEEKTPAESSPAAKTEVAAAAAPSGNNGGKPPETPPAPPAGAAAEPSPSRGKNAEARIKELLADNKKLAAEVEQLRKPVPAPAKKEEAVAKPRRDDLDQKTGKPLYASDDDFLEARDKWVFEEASKKTRADIAKEQVQLRIEEQNRINLQRWQNNLKIAKERFPDFDKVCEIDAKGAFQNAEIKSIKEKGIVDAWLLDSDYGGLMMYHFAKNPGEVARIDGMNSFAAARELTRIEERLSGEKSTMVATREVKAEEEGSKPQVSKAPAPASSTGGKATAPVDESEAAVNRGDFREYMRIENEKERLRKK